MPLNELWFLLIAVLFTGFFFLEGFDFGVGMATGLLPRSEGQRQALIGTIAPFWDANEVWLIAAAGAMFAAFPDWYATLFSGFYPVLTLLLLALILRGVSFEFRGKADSKRWRTLWDAAMLAGSAAPPFLFGVLFARLASGVPVGPDMVMRAGAAELFDGYGVFAGLTLTALCLLHGLTFLSLRTEGVLRIRSSRMAARLLPVVILMSLALADWTLSATDLFAGRSALLTPVLAAAAVCMVTAAYSLRKGSERLAFASTGSLILLVFGTLFAGLFPRLMISSVDSAFDLTIANSASGDYSLRIMTVAAACLLPFVLACQAWSYYVFRKRVRENGNPGY